MAQCNGYTGRSMKTTDSTARRARQLAGQRGGTNRGRGGAPPDGDDIPEAERMPPEDDMLGLLPGTNPYDRAFLRTRGRFGYMDAKTREQSNGELLNNEKRRMEIDQARGKLLTRAEHREAVAAIVTSILEASSSLATAAVSLHPPEQQPVARHQFEAALSKWREAAMALIKENK